mmetsp:Transcript_12342/g.53001  ORF Transcript_12342/g.53001 Transcript_12342/m.53001 type:complete len:209 (+) Transcript_12342:766-1392(+)
MRSGSERRSERRIALSQTLGSKRSERGFRVFGVFAHQLVQRLRREQQCGDSVGEIFELGEPKRRPVTTQLFTRQRGGARLGRDAQDGFNLRAVPLHRFVDDFQKLRLGHEAVAVQVVQLERELEPRLLLRERLRGAHGAPGRAQPHARVDVRQRRQELLQRVPRPERVQARRQDALREAHHRQDGVVRDEPAGAAEEVRERADGLGRG